jgi:hypothetical protein
VNDLIVGISVAVLAMGFGWALDRSHGMVRTLPVLGAWVSLRRPRFSGAPVRKTLTKGLSRVGLQMMRAGSQAQEFVLAMLVHEPGGDRSCPPRRISIALGGTDDAALDQHIQFPRELLGAT